VTAQTIVRVDFTELESVEIVCSRCGGAVIVPLPESPSNFPEHLQCPGCNQHWWGEGNERLRALIRNMALSMATWKRTDVPFKPRFSIPEKSPR